MLIYSGFINQLHKGNKFPGTSLLLKRGKYKYSCF
ncbi:hypothetical protein BACOVA_03374 [Bacteroides ovatus ATCC 8483]|uniref:Uncharacterized protein n=1 Tax=Bacteroides ovatus (strain ATCC 8483 / DSM 1896 / JCM 5824 / BCRC 10623 / CCUG 4943 / NCTC 11153) TaxID=411476 RepID=A0AAN3A6U0_BACO1|nr:hypothetical protein BACOVA_03374 [Bacteroides ovatus ATCC 8483]